MTSTLKTRAAAVVLAGAALWSGAAGSALAAPADVTCTGSISGTDVAGDLVVPAGAECVFSGGLVSGNVLVGAHAFASLAGTPVDGDITVAGTGKLSLDAQSTVAGNVSMDRSDVSARDASTGGVIAIHGSRVGSITVTGNDSAAAALVDLRILDSSVVAGDVTAQWASVSVANATVRGNLEITGGELGTVALQSAKINGDLSTSETRFQLLCSTTVRGTATMEDAQGLYVGDNPAPKSPSCKGSTFKKDLTVTGANLVVMVRNTVTGMADGSGNGQLVLRNNVFSGGTSGDFA